MKTKEPTGIVEKIIDQKQNTDKSTGKAQSAVDPELDQAPIELQAKQAKRNDKISRSLRDNLVVPKVFTNPLLSIAKVAELVGINEKYLSRYFKEVENCNFTSYINSLRVKESAALLLRDKEMNIFEISRLAGFNSHSTFLRCFQITYRQTPSSYRQFDGVNPDELEANSAEEIIRFKERMIERFPSLNDHDIRLCCLIAQDYTIRQQSEMLNMTYGSLLVTRCRLREKMHLERRDNLNELVKKILAEEES